MEEFRLTAEDRVLAGEFRDNPFGPHSSRLAAIVRAFRGPPMAGKYVLIDVDPHREWIIGRLTGDPKRPIEAFESCRFASVREAEWEVFKLRWREHAGEELPGEPVLEPGAPQPPPCPITLTAYADRISARPGETIRFMVNSGGGADYEAEIVRVICGDLNPEGPGYKEEPVESAVSGRYRGREQAIHDGSCVVVPDAPSLRGLASLSVSAMLWPTTPGRGEQTVIAKWSDAERRGFALMLDETGAVAFRVGDGESVDTVSTGAALRPREWVLAGASFDAESGRATVFQEPLRKVPISSTEGAAERELGVRPGETAAPLTIAAHAAGGESEAGRTASHYNGKIDSPRVAAAALSREELVSLRDDPLAAPALIAAWDFGREIPTTRVVDVGPNGLHGRTVNLPARAMKGWNWSGREMGWTHAAEEYGAIHFHDDDSYDAGWSPDFELTVPELACGLYAARLRSGEAEEYVPFYVRPARGAPAAKILFLAPTASYMAYGNFLSALNQTEGERLLGRLNVVRPQDIFLLHHPEYGRSLYDLHTDGEGIFHFSRLQPNLTMRPKSMRVDGGGGSSLRQFNADTHLIDWLEAMGHEYDVATDEDLHAEGLDCLSPYRVVVTGSHPEYHSTRMWESIKAYTETGGRLMYLGGNGFYWHIAWHEELPGVIEVRKADGTRDWEVEPGELCHAFTGEVSGLLRTGGRPLQSLAGVGMAAFGFGRGAPYRRTAASRDPRAAFIFEGVGEDETIGDFGLICQAAAGIEIDRAAPSLGTPPHALVVATSQGLHSDMFRVSIEELMANGYETSGTMHDWVRADMVYFETPEGGAVFSTGSITWCGALPHNGCDNNVSRITDNVLRRFAAED